MMRKSLPRIGVIVFGATAGAALWFGIVVLMSLLDVCDPNPGRLGALRFVWCIFWTGGGGLAFLILLVALGFFVAVMRVALQARATSARHGLCRCGYDLTGNISGVCPECGTKIENAQTPKSQNVEMPAQPDEQP